MPENQFKRSLQTGRLLIEVMVVLVIMLMFLAMLHAKRIDRQAERADVAIAEQMRALMASVKAFVESRRPDIEKEITTDICNDGTFFNTGCEFDLTLAGMAPYLPQGVNIDNPFYRDFRISIKINSDTVANSTHIAPMQIVMVSGNRIGNRALDNNRATHLAAMIGGAGGFIRTGDGTVALGNQGVWMLDTALHFPTEPKPDPVRIVMSSDFESHQGMLGNLSPYFDFYANSHENLPGSVGMTGDLTFTENPAQAIQFGSDIGPRANADQGTRITRSHIDTGTMTLDQIRNYYGTANPNSQLPYTINMDTGRIFMNSILTDGDIKVTGNANQPFVPPDPSDPNPPPPLYNGEPGRGEIIADDRVGVMTNLANDDGDDASFKIIRNPITGSAWTVITDGGSGYGQRNIVNIRNITASGEIAGHSLEIGGVKAGQQYYEEPGQIEENEGKMRIGNLAVKRDNFQTYLNAPKESQQIPGTIISQNTIQTNADGLNVLMQGRIRSTKQANPGDRCNGGEVAQFAGDNTNKPATLTCFNGRFTRSHPAFSCPSDNTSPPRHYVLVKRPLRCIQSPTSCKHLKEPETPNDPILCQSTLYSKPTGFYTNANAGCEGPDYDIMRGHVNVGIGCWRESRTCHNQTCARCFPLQQHGRGPGGCRFTCPAGYQDNIYVECKEHALQCTKWGDGCSMGQCSNRRCYDTSTGRRIIVGEYCFSLNFKWPTVIQ